jgi:hypothetical protein
MYICLFMTYLMFSICAEPTVSSSTKPSSRLLRAHWAMRNTRRPWTVHSHTKKSLSGQPAHSYFAYKTTSIIPCDVIHRLYQVILYFKNVAVCYCTRVNVIFYAHNQSTSFLTPIITKLRMFNYIVYRYLMSNFKQIGQ